ncbi:Imm50 family immunity protein [Streptomyces sp. WMMC940]|uniref:Imm50 family immunity protein n=1 Tax=Streptomyces sp. WMMC940 TaxID=3015153 RepID=UPI003FCD356A
MDPTAGLTSSSENSTQRSMTRSHRSTRRPFMNTSDWIQFLSNPEDLEDIYTKVPALSDCFLFYFHIDERNGVTLGFDTRSIPDRPRPEWVRKNFNAFEFFVTFSQVRELSISGWNSITNRSVTLARSTRDGISVRIENSSESISLEAESASVCHSRVYLAAASE